ncbi:MAG: tRNA-dihydrouridine synthase family protein [Myxococcota bacterium]|nr:tRNA-dihydrouridine synthase family protein [Myxococcota bacterium]
MLNQASSSVLQGLPFEHPTLLAPMEGVTNAVIRTLLASYGGIGAVCTEFVRIGGSPISPRAIQREVIKTPGVPLSVQVMGNDRTKMAEAAGIVAAAGADVVDINLGCPTRRALKGGVGAAMLRDSQLLYDVLSSMRKEVPGYLSAKMRAGVENTDSMVANAQAIEAAGADYLVVHPRRRVDQYKGVADWRIVKTLKETVQIPVVGNGDCWYAVDALRLEEETGCDGVMMGRSALRNPWIFQQIQALRAGEEPFNPGARDVLEYMTRAGEQYDRMFPDNPLKAAGRMKELVRYVGRTWSGGRPFVREILRFSSVSEMLGFAEDTLLKVPADQWDLDARGSLNLEPRPRGR